MILFFIIMMMMTSWTRWWWWSRFTYNLLFRLIPNVCLSVFQLVFPFLETFELFQSFHHVCNIYFLKFFLSFWNTIFNVIFFAYYTGHSTDFVWMDENVLKLLVILIRSKNTQFDLSSFNLRQSIYHLNIMMMMIIIIILQLFDELNEWMRKKNSKISFSIFTFKNYYFSHLYIGCFSCDGFINPFNLFNLVVVVVIS